MVENFYKLTVAKKSLKLRSGSAVPDYDGAHVILDVNKLQAVAKAFTTADNRLQRNFTGGVGEGDFNRDGGAKRNRTWNKGAHAALAEGIAAAKHGASDAGNGNPQAHVNPMPGPSALFWPILLMVNIQMVLSFPGVALVAYCTASRKIQLK
jgi:hypothetical protein